MTWGPFLPGLNPAERTARLRMLRMALRLLCGQRSIEVRHAILVAEIDYDPDTLARASAAFDGLAPLDRRRVLAAYQAET